MILFGVGFERPWWLLALLAVPALTVFYALALRARRAAMERLLGNAAPERLAVRAGRDRRAAEAAFAAATIALLATALAGPRWGEETSRVPRKGVDVVLVLDASRSMLAEDVLPSRIERARREIRGLLDAGSGSRIGLVTFAGDARMAAPLTVELDLVSMFVDEIDPQSDHRGGSNIAAGLRTAQKLLGASTGAGRAVVLLADGEDPAGPAAASVAAKLYANGTRVHVIGLGTPDGAKIPVIDDDGKPRFFRDGNGKEVITKLDDGVLSAVAKAGGGEYLVAANTAFPMDELWRKRISRLAAGDTGIAEIESKKARFQWFIAASLLTASLWWLAPLGVGSIPKLSRKRRRGLAGATAMLLLAPVSANAKGAEDGRKGDELYRKGDFSGAAAAYEEAARTTDTEHGPYNLGNARFRTKKFSAAARAWADAEKRATDPAARRDALYNRGVALLEQANEEEAEGPPVETLRSSVDAFNDALRLDPADEAARHNRAIAIARWVNAQKKAQQAGGGGSSKSGGPSDPSQKKDEQSKPSGEDSQKKEGSGDSKPGASPTPGDDATGAKDGAQPTPQPEGTEVEAGEDGEQAMSPAEMEKLDRMLEAREKEQLRLQRAKAKMHKKSGEHEW